jgi:hypothetical protein
LTGKPIPADFISSLLCNVAGNNSCRSIIAIAAIVASRFFGFTNTQNDEQKLTFDPIQVVLLTVLGIKGAGCARAWHQRTGWTRYLVPKRHGIWRQINVLNRFVLDANAYILPQYLHTR